MSIGAANTKGTYPSTQRVPLIFPFFKCGVDIEGTIFQVKPGIESTKIKGGGNLSMFQCKYRFNKTGNTGSRIQVPDIGFHRANRTESFFI